MKIENLDDHFAKLTREFERKERQLLAKVGNLAVRKFKENFQSESFFGQRWQEVKRRLKDTKGATGKRKILTGPTGNLGRSIQFTQRDGTVTVISDLPYSAAHNEGTSNAGRSHNVRIPQRRFIGDSDQLDRAILELIDKETNNIFK